MTSPNWKAAYAEIRPTYEFYERKLRDLVATVLEHAGIDVVQIDGRVKTVESFAEKVGRKLGKYADPLKDMTDLVGVRIIAYYAEDVEQIVSLLRSEFDVLEQHSANKQSELAPDQFGYTSNHLIVRIGSRGAWPEWAPYAGIPVEFQVRTTLQHAWAAVNHKLSYKRVEEVPTSLQRRLFRLSALFEMADEQFSAIRKATSDLSDEYSDNVRVGNLELEIDADSINAYQVNSPKVALIRSIVSKDLGFQIPASESHRSELIRLAGYLGANTIEEFDRLLPDNADTVRAVLNAREAVSTVPDSPYMSVYHALAAFCVALHPIEETFFKSLFDDRGWPILVKIKARLGEPGSAGSPDQLSR